MRKVYRVAGQSRHFRQSKIIRPECHIKFHRRGADDSVRQFEVFFSSKLHGSRADRWSQFADDKLTEKIVDRFFFLSREGRPETDYVLIARATTVDRPYGALITDLNAALRRIDRGQRKNQSGAAEAE